MCEGCAYRHGTAANQNGEGDVMLARVRRALLEANQSFFCHDDRYRFEGHRVLCFGHMEAMKAFYRSGFYDVSDEERARRTSVAVELCRERDRIYQEQLQETAHGD